MMKEVIAEIRERSGMTQERFAEEIGVNKDRIASLETGKVKKLTPEEISAIANKFQVSTEALLTGNKTIIYGNHNIAIHGSNNHAGVLSNNQYSEVCDLIHNYATPKLIEEFKQKLLKIKEVVDG